MSARNTARKSWSNSKDKRSPKPNRTDVTNTSETNGISPLDKALIALDWQAQPMNTKQMIDVMASKGHWVSQKDKTSRAVLFGALWRKIAARNNQARAENDGHGKSTSA